MRPRSERRSVESREVPVSARHVLSFFFLVASGIARAQTDFGDIGFAYLLAPGSPSLVGGASASNVFHPDPDETAVAGPDVGVLLLAADLGLPSAAVVDSVSSGLDVCGAGTVLLLYSVTNAANTAVGLAPPLLQQSTASGGNGIGGDVFGIVRRGCFMPDTSSRLGIFLDRNAPNITLVPGPAGDDLSGLDIGLAYRPQHRPIYFSLTAASAAALNPT
jgi:hypothetical protein